VGLDDVGNDPGQILPLPLTPPLVALQELDVLGGGKRVELVRLQTERTVGEFLRALDPPLEAGVLI
jgi:hypothetical protein